MGRTISKTKIMTYAIALVILIAVSIFCSLLAFYTSGLTAWFLPVSTIIVVLFLLFGPKVRWFPLRFVRYLSSAIFAYSIGIFIFGFLCWSVTYLNVNFFSEKARFPLSEVEWIAVDQKGCVYCLSFANLRLQVFDSEGKFLKGWFIRKPTDADRVALSKDGDVVIGSEGRAYYVYDHFGNRKPLNEEHSKNLTTVLSAKTTDNEGNTYELKSASLRPRIIKTDKNGHKFTLIKDPFGLWLHTIPLPVIGFLILTAIIHLITSKPK
jgi:hypothetical protein